MPEASAFTSSFPLELPPASTGAQLRFLLPHLNDLPDLMMPDGYSLREYRPGDDAAWAGVLNAAFPEERGKWTAARIAEEFLNQEPFRPERVFFIEHEGRLVATATAWDRGAPGWGYVHWVAVEPGHQGRRLGRLITLATLHQFRRDGYHAAMLDTDEPRLPAIATYLSLGFEPDLRGDDERRAAWERAKAALEARRR